MILHFTYIETVCRSMVMDTHKLCRAMEVYGSMASQIHILYLYAGCTFYVTQVMEIYKFTDS